MAKIFNKDKKKLELGITSTFYFEGFYPQQQYGRYYGILVNEVVKRQANKAKEENMQSSHFTVSHEVLGWSKRDLWESVKIAVLQNRQRATVLVVDERGNETIINVG